MYADDTGMVAEIEKDLQSLNTVEHKGIKMQNICEDDKLTDSVHSGAHSGTMSINFAIPPLSAAL